MTRQPETPGVLVVSEWTPAGKGEGLGNVARAWRLKGPQERRDREAGGERRSPPPPPPPHPPLFTEKYRVEEMGKSQY